MPPKDEKLRPMWMRILALIGLIVLPVAWIASLGAEPGYRITNVARVVGALVAAALLWLWRIRNGDARWGWGSLLIAGIAGSLAATALSVPLPALGRASAAGWLVSGAVGGAMVGLAILAITGGLSRRPPG
jgi:peptidoglycan biosynthesis protein MviN/MurJ (putative lipid II flippase)